MARTIKYWKFLVHAFCIILITHAINKCSVNYEKFINVERFLPDMKHILIWTSLHGVNEKGQKHFIKKKCNKINCYFTKNRNLFGDVRYFDAIVFNVQDLYKANLPRARGLNQKYIFAANDSADKYPVCNPVYDDFFNWTWTYRSDSTISYRFITIFNIHAQELGSYFPWTDHMNPIERNFQKLLSSKSRAAAVFHDSCVSKSNREGFIRKLQEEMSKYNLTIDIFGKCGTKKCLGKAHASCSWRLKKQYFFLLAMEDSLSPDFVTGVVLPAYWNNVVPIVYGGADYNKFLPPGSYLDAIALGVPELAKTMYETMYNKRLYYEFFKWRNHYSIHESKVLDACTLCDYLNKPAWLTSRGSYALFRKWWLSNYEERCKEGSYFSFY